MSGFEVQIGQLRKAAGSAASAAEQARAVEPGTGLEAVATALPGGEAARSAPGSASTFNDRATAWAGEIDRWGASVAASAQTYSETEDEAQRAFGG